MIVSGEQHHPHIPPIASRFSSPLDCLTAHLILECAEVLAGVKPANLISLVNRVRPCGRNMYELWDQHEEAVARSLPGLRFALLRKRDGALLLLCHDPEHLERHLAHNGIRALLARAGYDTATGSTGLLAQLSRRIGDDGPFPHEIGLFIGYPAKDVAAFMGTVNLPFACQSPWKMYGDPRESLCLAEACRRCRAAMGHRLTRCVSPLECLESRGTPFFSRLNIDNDRYLLHGRAS